MLSLCLGCGCQPALPPNSPLHQRWLPGWGFGLFGPKEIDLRDVCREGAAERVHVGASAATLVVGIVTLGVYTPRVLSVRCASTGDE